MEDADDLVSILVAASVNIVHVHIHRQLQQSYNNNTNDGTSSISGNSDPDATLPPTRAPTQLILPSDASRNRAILTILYVCVLSICFVTPLFYFLKLHLEDRNARRLRDLEIASIRAALRRSAMEDNSQNNNNNEQSRAMRHKYIEERRARILQLFVPVKMILKRENFPHLLEEGEDGCEAAAAVVPTSDDNEERKTAQQLHDDDNDVEAAPPNNDNEDGGGDGDLTTNEEEDHRTVLVPVPGLFFSEDAASASPSSDPDTANPRELRLTPAVCTICLCSYKIGSEIVWSSNADCEHCFHADCMERWLLRQRERPVCPCCRRDFIIDPYDVDDNDMDDDDDDNDDGDQVGRGYGEDEQDSDGGGVEAPERSRSLRNSSSTTGFQQTQANGGSTWPVIFVWEEPRGSAVEERSNV